MLGSGALVAAVLLRLVVALLTTIGTADKAAGAWYSLRIQAWMSWLHLFIPQRIAEAADLAELAAGVFFVLAILGPPAFVRTRSPVAAWLEARRQRINLVVSLCLAAGAVGCLLQHYVAGPILAAIAGTVWSVTWLLRKLPDREIGWLLPTFCLALGLRLALAVALHLYGVADNARGMVLDDESAYDLTAQALVGAVKFTEPNNGNVVPVTLLHITGPYSSLLMLGYWLFGPDPLTGRLLDAVIGTLAVVFGAAAVRIKFGRAAAAVTGVVLALLPGLFGWSSMLLKEAMISLLLSAAFWTLVCWGQQQRWEIIGLLAVVLHLLWLLRSYTADALAVVLAIGLAGWAWQRRPALRRLILVVVLGTGSVAAALFTFTGGPGHILDQAVYYQTVLALTPTPVALLGPDTSGLTDIPPALGGPIRVVRPGDGQPDTPGMFLAQSISPPGTPPEHVYYATFDDRLLVVSPDQVVSIPQMNRTDALRFVAGNWLHGTITALVGPLNSHDLKGTYLLLDIEACAWLAILIAAIAGYWRRPTGLSTLLLIFIGLVLLTLGLLDANPGNISRERASQCLVAAAIVAAPLLDALRRRLAFQARLPLLGRLVSWNGFASAPTGSKAALR